MSVLDAFVPENVTDGSVFVSVTDYGMTFSKASVEALGFPPFVRVYFDRKGKRMAIVPCEEEEGARRFSRADGSAQAGFVRWNDKKLLAQVFTMAGLAPGGKGVRALGEYIAEENLLVYHLRDTVPLRERSV